jgi:hypothetical protein
MTYEDPEAHIYSDMGFKYIRHSYPKPNMAALYQRINYSCPFLDPIENKSESILTGIDLHRADRAVYMIQFKVNTLNYIT